MEGLQLGISSYHSNELSIVNKLMNVCYVVGRDRVVFCFSVSCLLCVKGKVVPVLN
jgi:hypothetical protein